MVSCGSPESCVARVYTQNHRGRGREGTDGSKETAAMPENDRKIRVRPVTVDDVEAFRKLRIEALRLHPVSFTADLAQTEARLIETWREDLAKTGPTADSA